MKTVKTVKQPKRKSKRSCLKMIGGKRFVLTETEMQRVATLKATAADGIVLLMLRMLEDVLWDYAIGPPVWKAVRNNLVTTGFSEGVGIGLFVSRVIQAFREGEAGREAAERTLWRIVDLAYPPDPIPSRGFTKPGKGSRRP